MRIIDITVPLSPQTPFWSGEERVVIDPIERIADGEAYNVSRITMGAHAGTHMDAPFHISDNGGTIDQIPLQQLIGKTQVVHIDEEVERITAEVVQACPVEAGISALIFKTRNSGFWRQEPLRFREDYTALDSGAAGWIVSKGIGLVGIDWFSISVMEDLFEPHKILLDAGIAIVENLDLNEVPPGIYTLFCLPLKLVGTDGAPVRAILTRED